MHPIFQFLDYLNKVLYSYFKIFWCGIQTRVIYYT